MKKVMWFKKIAVLLLAVSFAVSPLSFVASAADYDGHWSAQYMIEARTRGWITPDAGGNFGPDVNITRGQFAEMLWKAMGSPTSKYKSTFTDIPSGASYSGAVTALAELGVVAGYDATTFGPNDVLTREMGLVLISRAWQLTPKDYTAYIKFSDQASIAEWARGPVSAMTEKGYVEGMGDGTCAPKRLMTRADMAKLTVVVYQGQGAAPLGSSSSSSSQNNNNNGSITITLKKSPTTTTSGDVRISVSVSAANKVSYIGWRESSSGASYTKKTGFEDITSEKRFDVEENGWYAVCVVDSDNNFAYELVRVTNIDEDADDSSSSSDSYSLKVYNLTGQSTSYGTVKISKGSSSNKYNASVTVTATPKTGCEFVKWVSSDSYGASSVSTNEEYKFNIKKDTTLYAVFTSDGSNSKLPKPISTADELEDVQDDLGGHYYLAANITLSSSSSMDPIGNNSSPFTGSFDGKGRTISKLAIDGSNYSGLFGCIGSTGVVRNLALTTTSVSGDDYVGGIAGENRGTIEDCYTTVSVNSSGTYVGGIAGANSGTIRYCYSTSTVKSTSSSDADLGGIVGWNKTGGKVENCAAINSSVVHNTELPADNIGKMVGNNQGTFGSKNVALSTMTCVSSGDGEDGTSTTDANLKKAATYTGMGWKTAIWNISSAYPKLKLQ